MMLLVGVAKAEIRDEGEIAEPMAEYIGKKLGYGTWPRFDLNKPRRGVPKPDFMKLTESERKWFVQKLKEEEIADSIGKKFGYDDWDTFVLNIKGQGGQKADFTKLSEEQRNWMLQNSRAQETRKSKWNERESTRSSYIMLVKLADPKTLELLRDKFKKGYSWAFEAYEACESAGELFLIPLAAETLFINQPERQIEIRSDWIPDPSPARRSAETIASVLMSRRTPSHLQKDAARLKYKDTDELVLIYRRWWIANREAFLKGDLKHVLGPSKFAPKANEKSK